MSETPPLTSEQGDLKPPPRTRRAWNAWALEQAADHLEHTVPEMLGDDAAELERPGWRSAWLMYPGITPEDRQTAEEAARRTAAFLRRRAALLLARDPAPPEEVAAPRETAETPPALADAARHLGQLGGRKGGKARAAKLTPERRREIGRLGAQARWGKKTES